MNKLISITILIVAFLTSCSNIKDIEQNSPQEDNSEVVFIKPKASYSRSILKDTIIAYDLGKYAEYGYPTDYIAGITSSHLNPLDKKFVYGYTSISSPCSITKGLSEAIPINISINDVALNADYTTKSSPKQANLKDMFGSAVTYNLSDPQHTKSGESDGVNVDMYVPKIIEIQYPEIYSQEQLYPLCLYNRFKLKWNADNENENGVMVVVEWHGSMVFGEDYPNAYIRSTDMVPDTGETYLKPEMFNGIPDTALCTLTILRGNIENELVNGVLCKLVAESHQCIQFILIRNVVKK